MGFLQNIENPSGCCMDDMTNRLRRTLWTILSLLLLALPVTVFAAESQAEIVSFPGDSSRALGGLIYKPEGSGPFPALLYNHGSAPGRQNDQAFKRLGPLFASHGWVFFAPYRRGQGLSAGSGQYILEELSIAEKRDVWHVLPVLIPALICALLGILVMLRKYRAWVRMSAATLLAVLGLATFQVVSTSARASALVHALETDQLQDHLAAYAWLKNQPFTDTKRIATAGNSFGGIITVLAAERVPYCAAIDAAGGSESWFLAPALQTRMLDAVGAAQAPIFLFQAENDYTTAPTRRLSAQLRKAGKPVESRIYPAFGRTAADGHAFAWRGSEIWSADVFRFLSEHCR
jgi:carboxymethylenebutenolidase